MKEFLAIVPPEITQEVRSFCATVSRRQEPVYVNVIPDKNARISHCFQNVLAKIQSDGGEIVYGWQIWMWPELFIEAEFHAIWKRADGSLVDITPKENRIERILFVPEIQLKYEGYNIDNIRKNLSKSTIVDLVIELSESIVLIQNYGDRKMSQEVRLSGDELALFKILVNGKQMIMQMIKNKISRNAPCACGSKEKFKLCCEKEIREALKVVKSHYV